MNFGLITVLGGIFTLFVFIVAALKRYKRCPSDKIMVIYGKTGKGKSAKCIHGGATFVWPIIQDYGFMSLTPMSLDIQLKNALSKQNIRVDVPSQFTIAISTDPTIMPNAAERLFGLDESDIEGLAKEIIFGQLRLVIAGMEIEQINSDRDTFLQEINQNVGEELKKIGLRLINTNITDISDESGYIQALGKEAAAKVINEAKVSVAQKDRDGEVGEKEAQREQRVKVADATAAAEIGEKKAEQKKRTEVADANARAIEGENKAAIDVANSTSDRSVKEAEAKRKADAASKVADAKAKEEGYKAEKVAEEARAEKVRAAKNAEEVVPAEIAKRKQIIEAEAIAEKTREEAKGKADAIFAEMDAKARGMKEIYAKSAEGLKEIVEAAGGDPNKAFMLMLADKLPELVKLQTEAIKNLKIDKITVWENGGGGKGGSSTSNFVQGLFGSLPQLEDVLKSTGMALPEFLVDKTKQLPENTKTTDADFKKDKASADVKETKNSKIDAKDIDFSILYGLKKLYVGKACKWISDKGKVKSGTESQIVDVEQKGNEYYLMFSNASKLNVKVMDNYLNII